MKVAAVGYLNALPLYAALIDDPRVELVLASPAEVARRLAEDECDVALMPVAAAASLGDDVRIVPGMAIGADGPVRSVIVVSECPTDEIETLALDLSSKTSVVLAKLLLGKKKFVGMPPDRAIAAVGGKTGALVIGDAALAIEGRFPHVLDLGAAWKERTGLPFVFAAWCTRRRRQASVDVDEALLRDAFERGMAMRDALPDGEVKRYLRESIRYGLGEREHAGLARFFDEARGLLPKAVADLREHQTIDTLIQRAADGERLSVHEGERLLAEGSLFDLGLAADTVRKRKHPQGVVTYIVDRNISYTNVCTTSCRFCAFYRPVGHAEGYVLSRDVLAKKLQEVVEHGGVQILLQGGLNPDLRIEWYEDLFRWIKTEFKLGLHALSPEEILHIARLEKISMERVLERLHAAGLDSVPGGGAEILVDRVRRKIAKAKCTSSEWLGVMRAAHHMGLRSSSTMMYGTVDTPRDRILHLLKLRDLQDETGGFTAFFCWDFQYEKGTRVAPGDTGTHLYLRTQAVARLMLDNIDHVGASWVTQGPDVGQVALRFGADDFGSVMFEENVVSSAGTVFCIDAAEIERRIHDAGFQAVRRNVRYEWLNTPS